jgi:hypothetical protein
MVCCRITNGFILSELRDGAPDLRPVNLAVHLH